MKKMMSLMLAFILILGMGSTVMATEQISEEPTAKEADLTDHTYTAYQIFAGTLIEDDAKLTDIKWGDGVNSGDLMEKLKADPTISADFASLTVLESGEVKAADVATIIERWNDDDAKTSAFARCVNSSIINDKGKSVGQADLPPGYYLIVDTTEFADAATDTVRNTSFLRMIGNDNLEIENKTDVPEVEKKVGERNDSTDADPVKYIWQDAADYDFGDEVPFRLTGTLPDNYEDYVKYKYVFHDTLSARLVYVENSAKIYVDNIEVNGFEVESEGTKLTISCKDLKGENAITNKETKEAVSIIKDNEIVVEYKAKLTNNDAVIIGELGNPNTVYLEYSNDPNQDGEGTPTGKTPEDKVVVFTYKFVTNKVDKDNNTLKGAGFTLYKWDAAGAKWSAVGDEIKGTDITTFEFKGIDAGKYKLEETTVPEGYNKANDLYFEVTATYDRTAEDPELTGLSVKVTDKDGKELNGDDAAKIAVSTVDGTLSTNIVNNSGVTFPVPDTGGMGTRIFYILGGILVLGCGVILIARKRAKK